METRSKGFVFAQMRAQLTKEMPSSLMSAIVARVPKKLKSKKNFSSPLKTVTLVRDPSRVFSIKNCAAIAR